jgi:multidrug resistance protein, MATE family
MTKPTTDTPALQSHSIGRHISETVLLALPVILGQLGHVAIGTADTIFVGNMGSSELSAATIALGLFFLVAVIGIGVCVVISPLTAQAIGEGQSDEVLRRRFHQGIIVSFWLGLASMAILFGLSFAIPYLGQQPESVPLAQSFLRILAISIIPMLLYLAIKHYLDGFEAVVPGMVIMAIMVILNIFFNWIFINGHWGVPAMGLNGSGWATLTARCIGVVIILLYVMRSEKFSRYFRLKDVFIHRIKEIREILKIGLPSGLQYFFEVGAFSGAVFLAGRISTDAQSAHQIAIQIASTTYMFYLGLSSAASIRVGNALGRRDSDAIKRASIAALLAGLGCVLIFVSTIIGLHKFLPHLYIKELPVIEIASKLLFIAAVFQVFDGMQAIVMGALRGISDVTIPTAFTFIAYWVIGLPMAWLFSEPLGMGVEGIWYGLTFGLAFSALMLSWRLINKTRRGSLLLNARPENAESETGT